RAAMMMTACTADSSPPETPSRLSSENKASSVSAPATAATTEPRPPPSTTPPRTTAVMTWNSNPSPTCADTPANPPSRIAAIAAEIPDSTNASVRRPSTPPPPRRTAVSLSPTATSSRPVPPRRNTTAATTSTASNSTDHGTWPNSGISKPSRPTTRNASDNAPWGAPPVHRNTAPSSTSNMPSVTMNDGTNSRVVISPLTSPTSAPRTSNSGMTHAVAASSPSSNRAAITTSAVTNEPTDRSNPPLTMTKYWPRARIINGAARLSRARY